MNLNPHQLTDYLALLMRVKKGQNGAHNQVPVIGAPVQLSNGFLHSTCNNDC